MKIRKLGGCEDLISESVVIVGIIRRKPVLTYASIIFGDMLASVNSVNSVN